MYLDHSIHNVPRSFHSTVDIPNALQGRSSDNNNTIRWWLRATGLGAGQQIAEVRATATIKQGPVTHSLSGIASSSLHNYNQHKEVFLSLVGSSVIGPGPVIEGTSHIHSRVILTGIEGPSQIQLKKAGVFLLPKERKK